MKNWQDWTDAELEPVARALSQENAGIAKTPTGAARAFIRRLERFGLTIAKQKPPMLYACDHSPAATESPCPRCESEDQEKR